MRLALLLPLSLAACATAPSNCTGAELSRAELLGLVKDKINATGGRPGMVDDGTLVPKVANQGCDYQVRLAFPPPRTGDYATYVITRDGSVTRVFK